MKNNKVILIGIDGGTFDVILPMIERGELPNLASMMNKGAWGELESTVPPDTGPAWVSMMTGVNPGKHGIFFFLGNSHDNYSYTDRRTLSSTDIRFPGLGSILSKNNKKVLFLNVPFTFPPTEVNGIVISGMFIPNRAQVISYPSNIYPDIVKKLGKYEINDWSREAFGINDLKKIHLHYNEIVEIISRITEDRKKATLMLLEEDDWDFSMVVFTSIDRLQHYFWEFMHPSDGVGNNSFSSQYSDVIYDGYRQVDNAIGEILEKAGRDTTVIIASDHGFGPLKKDFFVNKWLEELGLFKLRNGISSKRIKLTLPSLYRILKKIKPDIALPNWIEKIQVPIPRFVGRDRHEKIDWRKTKAYVNEGGININIQGREPYGSVPSGKEVEDLLTFIQEKFHQLNGGSKVTDWIRRKEDIYSGPFVGEASDLYFSVKNRSYMQNSNIDVNSKFGNSSIVNGAHRMNGIFIMNGPLCRKSDSVSPKIIDIAPTILYLLGLPVLEEMDGSVLEDVIDTSYTKFHPIKFMKSFKCDEKGSFYSAEEEENIKDSLKGLGYLS
jgi:predicted AlkP superfamily phosphohydrolase/phosphomutase